MGSNTEASSYSVESYGVSSNASFFFISPLFSSAVCFFCCFFLLFLLFFCPLFFSSKLSKLGYYILFHVFGVLCILPWIHNTSPHYREYIRSFGSSPVWW